MKKLLTAALMAGCACSLAGDACAKGRLATTSPLVRGNDTIVDNDVVGTDGNSGDVGPTSDGDPDDNPFTSDDWEVKQFDDPDLPGMQYVVVDATDYADDINVVWTPNGLIRIFGESRVNDVVIASFDELYNPNYVSRISLYALGGSDDVKNWTEMDLFVDGGAGNDIIDTGFGYANVKGGDGDDRIYILGTGSSVSGGPGDDRIFGSQYSDQISGDAGNDTIYGLGGNDRIEGDGYGSNLIGVPEGAGYDDIIFGGHGDDAIYGGTGVDKLHGGPGDDYLHGFSINGVDFRDGDDDKQYDVIYGDDGADRFKGHEYPLTQSGTWDYPYDFNANEGDVLDIETHWWPW